MKIFLFEDNLLAEVRCIWMLEELDLTYDYKMLVCHLGFLQVCI